MKELLCVILGGGRGTRLYPLTKERSKPAVPFAGKYRLVDIPISNSLNSGFIHIYVLTQFNSESLNKHVTRTYKLDPFTHGFVEIMAAEQSMESTGWFQGTADAVRRCFKHFNNPCIKYILVLSGDQLYKMDFRRLLQFHLEKRAEITIATKPVEPGVIKEFGIMCVDKTGRINNFIEKPQDESAIKKFSVDFGGKRHYLASMGIYLFNKETLMEILFNNTKTDFGKEIIPDSFEKKFTYAYVHDGHWNDIGTIKTFYEENLILTEPVPPVNLFDEQWQFFTRSRYLAPAKIEGSTLDRAIIAEGSILRKANISHSVIGLRSRVGEDAVIEDSIIMGADYYETLEELGADSSRNMPFVGVERGSVIKRAIVDKNARIGEGVKIINQKGLATFDSNEYCIRDGIVIIPKNTTIPSGTVI